MSEELSNNDKSSPYDLRKVPSRTEKARQASNKSSKRKRSSSVEHERRTSQPISPRRINPRFEEQPDKDGAAGSPTKKTKLSDPPSQLPEPFQPTVAPAQPPAPIHHDEPTQPSAPCYWPHDVVSSGLPTKIAAYHSPSWNSDDDDDLTQFVKEWRWNPYTGYMGWQIAILGECNFRATDWRGRARGRHRRRDGRDVSPGSKPAVEEMDEVEWTRFSMSVQILLDAVEE